MSTPVEQIKERLSIEEVVGGYLSLTRAGTYLKACCPFHQEKTPSFFVSPERGTYYCFGCGAKGDVFTFVEQFDGVDFSGALRLLAERAGVPLSQEKPEVRKERERLHELLEAATQFFTEQLHETPTAQEYLRGRGLSDATIRTWRLGYAPDAWEAASVYLKARGFSADELAKAGMTKDRERGGAYDRFRGRVMFPLMDAQGRIVGFSGRIFVEKDDDALPGGGQAPKYLNSPETQLFNKSKLLYGLSFAKAAIRKHDFSIVVEGQLDVLLSHQIGFTTAVATSGTALGRGHLEALHRFSDNVLFAFDSDAAGIGSSVKSAALALSMGMNPKVAPLPEGADPADIISDDPTAWRGVVRNAQHVIDFYLDVLTREAKDARALSLSVHADVLPLVRQIPNKMDQAHFIRRIAERLDMPESAIQAELEKTEPAALPADDAADAARRDVAVSHGSRKAALLTSLAGILEWQESLEDPVIDAAAVRRQMQEHAGEEDVPERAEDAATMAQELYADTDITALVEEQLAALEELALRDQLHETLRELREAERAGDQDRAAKILETYTKLSHQASTQRYSAN